jgi:hypothetical protein
MLLASTPVRRPAAASKSNSHRVALSQIWGLRSIATMSWRCATLRRRKAGHFDHLGIISRRPLGHKSCGRCGEGAILHKSFDQSKQACDFRNEVSSSALSIGQTLKPRQSLGAVSWGAKRHYAPAPDVRPPGQRTYAHGENVLVRFSHLLDRDDRVEGVESIKRLPFAAFENNDAASRCATTRGGRSTPRCRSQRRIRSISQFRRESPEVLRSRSIRAPMKATEREQA